MKKLNYGFVFAAIGVIVMYLLEIMVLGNRIEWLLGDAMLAIIFTILATHT